MINELGLSSIKSMVSIFVWGNSTVDACSSLNILTDPSVSIFQRFVEDIEENSVDKDFMNKIQEMVYEEVKGSGLYTEKLYVEDIRRLFSELMTNNNEYQLLLFIIQSCDSLRSEKNIIP